MQRTTIIGRIGGDATINELKTTSVINFNVAVSEKYNNKDGEAVETTTWYRCAKWGQSTKVADYLKKGTQVYLEGTCSAQSYLNKEGEAVGALCLNVQKLELLGGGNGGSTPVAATSTKSVDTAPQTEDLPF